MILAGMAVMMKRW